MDLIAALRGHPLISQPWAGHGPIEVQDQRANERGTPNWSGVLNHHTVSSRNGGRYPSLSICRNGRGGSAPVPGPLCNILGARGGGSVAVVSSRVANHAGLGDPDVLRRARAGLPPKPHPAADQHNAGGGTGWVGIEWENDGTGEPWAPLMIDTIVRVNAALCDIGRWDPAVAVLGHLEWTRRKVDPAFITPAMSMSDLRRLTVTCLATWRGAPPEDDMTPQQSQQLADVAASIPGITDQLDGLTARVDSLAVGPSYQGHAWPGLIPAWATLRRHLAGDQADDTKTLRSIIEAIRNRVG